MDTEKSDFMPRFRAARLIIIASLSHGITNSKENQNQLTSLISQFFHFCLLLVARKRQSQPQSSISDKTSKLNRTNKVKSILLNSIKNREPQSIKRDGYIVVCLHETPDHKIWKFYLKYPKPVEANSRLLQTIRVGETELNNI